jgi:ABC-type multidrug transport system ATPase subunit
MLSISNITKTYPGGVRALERIELEIGPGMFGLLGPNGAGKSTLMRTIAGLQAPDSGRILLDGVDIVAHPQVVRERLGYLPQDFGVYPHISAFDLLDHLALLKGVVDRRRRRDQVESLLAQTNLADVRNTAVSTFSGGMKQRFGIAQALLGDPRLIIVDEPTAGLDPAERHRFHNLLVEIGERVVVVLSTHIVEDVRDLCSHMAILVRGRIQAVGEPEQLLTRLAGRVWRLEAPRAMLPSLLEGHQLLSTRLAAGRSLVHVLADEPPGPDFRPVEPSIEDLYFSVLAQES